MSAYFCWSLKVQYCMLKYNVYKKTKLLITSIDQISIWQDANQCCLFLTLLHDKHFLSCIINSF